MEKYPQIVAYVGPMHMITKQVDMLIDSIDKEKRKRVKW